MRDLRWKSVAPFGLLGRVLGHSWSPQIHTQLGSAPYQLHELEPDELEPFIREAPWQGLNVTIPYKPQAFELADEASEAARRLGVANTLVRRDDGTIFADNTDLPGFAWMLSRFCKERLGASSTADALAGRPVLVFGNGGASKAVQAALGDAGARLTVFDIDGPTTYDALLDHTDAVLIVNTTPVGMSPKCPASLVSRDDLARFHELRGVVDVVYNPRRTGICLAAEELGLPYQSGLAMLVAQARFSSELFQGRELPDEVVGSIEQEILRETQNVVIIGMPGAGKTAVGKRLAHMTGRPFVDLDDAFEVEQGISCAECINTRGEEAFRELESETAARYGSRSGLIIACGGGIVTRAGNYPLLHQNGTIVMIDRPLEELSSEGRPMSQTRGIERLAAERMGLYRSWADLIVACTGTPEGDAEVVRAKLGI